MAATYKFILENEVISSTKGALVVVTAYWKALKNDFGKTWDFVPTRLTTPVTTAQLDHRILDLTIIKRVFHCGFPVFQEFVNTLLPEASNNRLTSSCVSRKLSNDQTSKSSWSLSAAFASKKPRPGTLTTLTSPIVTSSRAGIITNCPFAEFSDLIHRVLTFLRLKGKQPPEIWEVSRADVCLVGQKLDWGRGGLGPLHPPHPPPSFSFFPSGFPCAQYLCPAPSHYWVWRTHTPIVYF